MKKKEKNSKNSFFVNFKKVYVYFKECKSILIGIGIITLIKSIIGVFIPLLTAKVILYLTDGVWEQLLTAAALVMLFEILSSIFFIIDDKLSRKLKISVDIALQTRLTKEMLDVHISELDTKGTGVFIERLNSDASSLAWQFMSFTSYISSFLTSSGILLSVFIISKIMFVYLFGVAFIIYLIRNRRTKIQNELRKE